MDFQNKASSTLSQTTLPNTPSARLPKPLHPLLELAYCIGFLLAIVGCVGLGVAGGVLGDLGRLRKGWDVYGNACGEGLMADLPMTYFPVPLESLEVALCVSACPLESVPESICIYNSNREIDWEQICYDSYPSRPVYSYCLPAQGALRSPVLGQLLSLDQLISLWMSDILKSLFPLGIAALASIVMAYYFLLFPFICPFTLIYKLSHFMVIWGMGFISYSLYIQAERSEEMVCGDYENVHMEQCSTPKSGYKFIFYAYSALFWIFLILLTQIYKQKNDIFPIIKAVISKGSVPLCLSQCFLIATGLVAYSLFLILTVYQTSIGFSSDFNDKSVFPYPGQTWSFSWPSRGLLLFTYFMAVWVFETLAACGVVITCEFARGKGVKETVKSCWKASGTLVSLGTFFRYVAIWFSVVPCLRRFLRGELVSPSYISPSEGSSPSVPPGRDFISVSMATLPLETCIALSGPVVVFAYCNDSPEVTSPICLAVVSGLFSQYVSTIVGSYYYGLALSGAILPVQVSVAPADIPSPLSKDLRVAAISEEVSFRPSHEANVT